MTADAASLARHDLVLVAPGDWRRVTTGLPADFPAETRAVVEGWAAAGRPVIARRAGPCEAAGSIGVGLPLPPSLGKRRIALTLPEGTPWTARAPVSLADARPTAPAAWAASLDRIAALATRLGIAPRVFGSLLWQAVTGLDYLHPASDLDLLWPIDDPALIRPLVEGLAAIEREGGPQLDGELLLPGGGVNWREIAAADDDGSVLVKSLTSARLERVGALLPEREPCC